MFLSIGGKTAGCIVVADPIKGPLRKRSNSSTMKAFKL